MRKEATSQVTYENCEKDIQFEIWCKLQLIRDSGPEDFWFWKAWSPRQKYQEKIELRRGLLQLDASAFGLHRATFARLRARVIRLCTCMVCECAPTRHALSTSQSPSLVGRPGGCGKRRISAASLAAQVTRESGGKVEAWMEGYAAAALLALLVLLTIFVAVSDVMLPNVSDLRRKKQGIKECKEVADTRRFPPTSSRLASIPMPQSRPQITGKLINYGICARNRVLTRRACVCGSGNKIHLTLRQRIAYKSAIHQPGPAHQPRWKRLRGGALLLQRDASAVGLHHATLARLHVSAYMWSENVGRLDV